MGSSQSEQRLGSLADTRAHIHGKHEAKLAEMAARDDDGLATHDDKQILRDYREQLQDIDAEMTDLTATIEAQAKAEAESRNIRRIISNGSNGLVELDGDGSVVYPHFIGYAYDYFITRSNVSEVGKITRQWGIGDAEIAQARERLSTIERVANTLSSGIAGLTPPQHIAEIFQVINKNRNLVNAASRADLERGTLTYPSVDTPPVVAVQNTEKTEAGNTAMAISMVTKTASTYLGGGDLSWQAVNWSTPNALRLWFDLVAADYALKTETDAATIVSASAFLNNAATLLGATPTFAEFAASVGSGYAEVWANSGRTANSIIMAPDRFGYILGLTSAAFTQFMTVSGSQVGPLNVIVSRGLNAGEIIVGDVSALLCAETPGAPVEMQVVEPAIGGVEVGLIGAFEAAVVDDGAFAAITTAS